MLKKTDLPKASFGDEEKRDDSITESVTEYRAYAKRWFVVASLSLVNLSTSMVWFSMSPIAYKVASYYGTTVGAVNWLSTIFLLVSIPCGILYTWLLNRVGLKACLLSAAWISFLGAGIRILSTIECLSSDWQLACLFIGQILVAIVQPLALYCSPKVAAEWFPARQRSISTTIAGVFGPLGLVTTGLISPLFLDAQGNVNMRMLLITYASFPAFCAILMSFVMTTDGPPTPASYGSTRTTSDNFLRDVVLVLRNKEYVLLMIAVGCGISLYVCFATLLEQVLCPWGYTDKMAGTCASTMTGAGLVGAVVWSVVVDKTKKFAELLKFMFICAATATIAFSFTYRNYMGYWITCEMALLGFLAFGISPIGLNTAAEITFPVGVSIGTGLIQLSGQIQSVVMLKILQSVGRPMSAEELSRNISRCHIENADVMSDQTPGGVPVTYDHSVSAYIMCGVVSLVAIVFLIFFRPTYRRMQAEREMCNEATTDVTIKSDIYSIEDDGQSTSSCSKIATLTGQTDSRHMSNEVKT